MKTQVNDVDSILVPGMLNLNVKEAIEKVTSLCVEMREGADLCNRLLVRLLFLRDELPKRRSKMNAEDHAKALAQFANTIRLVMLFLNTFSEKKLLQRIAANRLLIKEVERLHMKIGDVFRSASLSNSSKMNEWKTEKDNDIAKLRRNVEELARNRSDLVRLLSGSELEEAITELAFEIDPKKNPRDFMKVLESVLAAVMEQVEDAKIPEIPDWFIRRDDILLGDEFDQGSYGAVHKGKWGDEETKVCVKLLFMDGEQTQADFLRESNIWFRLNHPHVVKMLGGCHVGKPFFFVSEFAKHSNFTDYLLKSENKNKLWRLFHQAAQGLSFLHSKRIVHSDIKCTNILVGNDGSAKLCDFGFSYIKTLSIGKSIKAQPSVTRWKAPECLLEQGAAANPTFKSDVYSLGMAIIEAAIDAVPWGMTSDDDIIEQVASGAGYPRPDGLFSDKEWGLIRAMTEFEPEERIPLVQVVDLLHEFARAEEEKFDSADSVPAGFVRCGTCHKDTPAVNKFCGECGAKL